jgi:hypothetical protein
MKTFQVPFLARSHRVTSFSGWLDWSFLRDNYSRKSLLSSNGVLNPHTLNVQIFIFLCWLENQRCVALESFRRMSTTSFKHFTSQKEGLFLFSHFLLFSDLHSFHSLSFTSIMVGLGSIMEFRSPSFIF